MLVFVYGTLRKACPSGVHQQYLAGADFLGNGKVQGRLYRISYYPGLVLGEPGWVQGEVYRLRSAEQLGQLDNYEGCSTPPAQGDEYLRMPVEVLLEGTTPLQVWAYIYVAPRAGLSVIPSGDFLAAPQACGHID